ncbi:uncharacterized protein C19orf47 homolog isoform X2 [Limulus polyphemus]|uniref:Uncharacterized protein C19orf47 homolog isoform X2 n=1 Tax=Limulus polyphemus TaxID=6850 RepID=A0ABM1TKQ8_LIMPO|nr:uncharacterized protein C19orf47 homolog isoform X2 [Limulus polyphemus]
MAPDTTLTTSEWIEFFSNAGLPASVAANYAITFIDHRIRTDMLTDLTKEYLYDMGIKTMGDVIAILRQAKIVHDQALKDKMLGKVQTPNLSSSKKSTPTRMLDRYTRRLPESSKDQGASEVPTSVGNKTCSAWDLVDCTGATPIKLSIKRKSEEEALIPKVRRVLPEHEGGYKIKMPIGTTEKTRNILKKQGLPGAGLSKRSVFDRLGESAVSSSTDLEEQKTPSVFKRLGVTRPSEMPTSSTVDENETDTTDAATALQYRGVLKTFSTTPGDLKVTKIVKKVPAIVTSSGQKVSIMRRLGPKITAASSTSTRQEQPSLILKKSLLAAGATSSHGILVGTDVTRSASIKNRLGQQKAFMSAQHQPTSVTVQAGQSFLKSKNTRTLLVTAGNIVAKAKATATGRMVKSAGEGNRTVFQRLGN